MQNKYFIPAVALIIALFGAVLHFSRSQDQDSVINEAIHKIEREHRTYVCGSHNQLMCEGSIDAANRDKK